MNIVCKLIIKLINDISSLVGAMAKRGAALTKLAVQLDKEKQDNAKLREMLSACEDLVQITELKDRITELETQNAQLKVRLEDTRTELARAQDAVLKQVADERPKKKYKQVPVRRTKNA